MELDEFTTALDDFGDYIAHHGVKGMKWGVRRNKKQSGSPKGNIGSQNKSSISSVVKNGLSNKKVRVALGIAGVGIAAVAAYTLAGPQIASAIKQGSNILNDWAQRNDRLTAKEAAKKVERMTKKNIKDALDYGNYGRAFSSKRRSHWFFDRDTPGNWGEKNNWFFDRDTPGDWGAKIKFTDNVKRIPGDTKFSTDFNNKLSLALTDPRVLQLMKRYNKKL